MKLLLVLFFGITSYTIIAQEVTEEKRLKFVNEFLIAVQNHNQKSTIKHLDKTFIKEQLKKFQIKSIINSWLVKQKQSERQAQSKGINPISLYNKRGSAVRNKFGRHLGHQA